MCNGADRLAPSNVPGPLTTDTQPLLANIAKSIVLTSLPFFFVLFAYLSTLDRKHHGLMEHRPTSRWQLTTAEVIPANVKSVTGAPSV